MRSSGFYQGRGDEQLIELSRQAAGLHPRMAVWAASTAHVRSPLRQPGDGARASAGDVADDFARIGWDTLRLVALSFYTEAAARLGDRDAAALAYEQMAPWQEHLI